MSEPREVAAKQIVFYDDCLFMVDAAGQLWRTDYSRAPQFHVWTRIPLPEVEQS